jgi:hypothetical protein
VLADDHCPQVSALAVELTFAELALVELEVQTDQLSATGVVVALAEVVVVQTVQELAAGVVVVVVLTAAGVVVVVQAVHEPSAGREEEATAAAEAAPAKMAEVMKDFILIDWVVG